jgi:hypothetical protein
VKCVTSQWNSISFIQLFVACFSIDCRLSKTGSVAAIDDAWLIESFCWKKLIASFVISIDLLIKFWGNFRSFEMRAVVADTLESTLLRKLLWYSATSWYAYSLCILINSRGCIIDCARNAEIICTRFDLYRAPRTPSVSWWSAWQNRVLFCSETHHRQHIIWFADDTVKIFPNTTTCVVSPLTIQVLRQRTIWDLWLGCLLHAVLVITFGHPVVRLPTLENYCDSCWGHKLN